VILLCLGMAERDGVVILLGHVVTLFATAFVGTMLWLAAKAGSDPRAALDALVTCCSAGRRLTAAAGAPAARVKGCRWPACIPA